MTATFPEKLSMIKFVDGFCRGATGARFPECNIIEAVNASIMMNLHVLLLVIYSMLCGLYETPYAVRTVYVVC